jgi:hypothetical protein
MQYINDEEMREDALTSDLHSFRGELEATYEAKIVWRLVGPAGPGDEDYEQ